MNGLVDLLHDRFMRSAPYERLALVVWRSRGFVPSEDEVKLGIKAFVDQETKRGVRTLVMPLGVPLSSTKNRNAPYEKA